mmetsp:Transcript_33564/g.81150  ORF Transcript_33564/g.81150 Transcript_33564/m.81150 type:complete len:208 (-) Transcript_33564:728-1351(-)
MVLPPNSQVVEYVVRAGRVVRDRLCVAVRQSNLARAPQLLEAPRRRPVSSPPLEIIVDVRSSKLFRAEGVRHDVVERDDRRRRCIRHTRVRNFHREHHGHGIDEGAIVPRDRSQRDVLIGNDDRRIRVRYRNSDIREAAVVPIRRRGTVVVAAAAVVERVDVRRRPLRVTYAVEFGQRYKAKQVHLEACQCRRRFDRRRGRRPVVGG